MKHAYGNFRYLYVRFSWVALASLIFLNEVAKMSIRRRRGEVHEYNSEDSSYRTGAAAAYLHLSCLYPLHRDITHTRWVGRQMHSNFYGVSCRSNNCCVHRRRILVRHTNRFLYSNFSSFDDALCANRKLVLLIRNWITRSFTLTFLLEFLRSLFIQWLCIVASLGRLFQATYADLFSFIFTAQSAKSRYVWIDWKEEKKQ